MYYSLEKFCKNFHLYIFAFDDNAASILQQLGLKHVTIITLKQFEDEKLLTVKPSRSRAEYCWTCTSSTVLYVLQNYDVDCCTYLDADLFFFDDPKILLDELQEKSVLITEHRYSREHDQSEESGKYCVQFVTFKKNEEGLRVLNWWRDACIDWCYNDIEDGKFGDQKYLDDWTTKFSGVHELQNLGGGVAPWNVTQYGFKTSNAKVIGEEKATQKQFALNFYHFHSLKFIDRNSLQLADKIYHLDNATIKLIYAPYLEMIDRVTEILPSKFSQKSELKVSFPKKIKLSYKGKNKNIIHKKWLTSLN